MGREKRGLPAAVAGGPKERHRRAQRSQYDPTAPVPQGFVAKPAIPKTKHHSYFEFVENKDKKKKKLEFQITTKNTPPPGFEFVPAGNPELTTACKELSRDKDAMIFIVSNAKDNTTNTLSHQVHRIGHHIRETIVEEARASLGHILDRTLPPTGGSPEPIPESQEEYDAQVDAALRDLFPRIPNTDRQMIIEHAFRRGTSSKTEKVGLSADITLARRVQLAVLAHIRHTHTRYDTLLRETTWQNARKVVEALCLDTLVKWRGDEESGRDQLDEILREVVVISDSEEESGEETDDSVEEVMPQPRSTLTNRLTSNISGQDGPGRRQSPRLNPGAKGPGPLTPAKQKAKVKKAKRKTSAERKGQRGFKRYQAWQEALERSRGEPAPAPQSPVARSLPYTHVPPPTGALALRDDEFPPASQLRIVPERAGPAPNENGYVGKPHHPPSNQFMNPGRESFSPVARKVKSPFNESSPVTRRPVSRITSRLQDMLVPSIEPASPEAMKPSFIRTVPPRPQAFRDELPFGSRIQHPSTVSSPLRGLNVRDDPTHISRPDRFAPEDRPYDGRLNGPGQAVLHREQDYAPRNGSRIVTAPLYRSDARPALHTPPAIAVSRRPYEEAPRPGDRDSPIVMEDRGGFYQRVPVRGDGTRLAAHDPGFVEYRRPTRETRRVEEPRPVSWHEGPRVLHDSRHGAGIEVIPITRAPPLEARPRPILVESRSAPYLPAASGPPSGSWRYVEREPQLVHHDAPSLEARLITSDYPGLRREPYREIRIEERPPEAFQQREPIPRHYGNQPPLAPNNGRTHPLHPRQPENVIVLE
ncbi:DUF2293 domain-containing protein [Fusarium falciforme]|uniref:DUF2293 domain-containing protein n=1 Tax=Fusarium falciforme TaxID=195108 RepID=UPI00230041EA|nr:DUF2293 domain-containing protein [Fusarium falciforme]WAO83099.1 DUF2293 domain-containing protein [Fusarium falciforme]